MASLRRSKTLTPDGQTARFLYTILKQLDLKTVDWNEVAEVLDITNGHAARMRYSRFKQQIEAAISNEEKEKSSTGEPKSKIDDKNGKVKRKRKPEDEQAGKEPREQKTAKPEPQHAQNWQSLWPGFSQAKEEPLAISLSIGDISKLPEHVKIDAGNELSSQEASKDEIKQEVIAPTPPLSPQSASALKVEPGTDLNSTELIQICEESEALWSSSTPDLTHIPMPSPSSPPVLLNSADFPCGSAQYPTSCLAPEQTSIPYPSTAQPMFTTISPSELQLSTSQTHVDYSTSMPPPLPKYPVPYLYGYNYAYGSQIPFASAPLVFGRKNYGYGAPFVYPPRVNYNSCLVSPPPSAPMASAGPYYSPSPVTAPLGQSTTGMGDVTVEP